MTSHSSKILFLLLLILSSCELIVDIDVPYDGDKIVVNALQQPDSTWYVELSLTRNVVGRDDGFFIPVNNANVIVTNNDGTAETLSFAGNGLFRGTTVPEPGQTYHLEVESSFFDPVEAEMTMPSIVPIVEVKWDSSQVDNGSQSYYTNVPFTVTFDDPADVRNFYTVQVYYLVQSQYETGEDHTPVEYRYWRMREANIQDDLGIAAGDDYVVYFADRTFDGRRYTAHFTNQFVVQPPPYEKLLEVKVLLISMSEENYKYQTTRDLQDDVQGDPFAQPVQVFSNMSNGFGIFAGNSMDVRTWKY